MNFQYIRLLVSLVFILSFVSCEKEIVVDIPDAEEQIVVEGTIEPGLPPFILLTKSQGYFAPTDLNTLSNLYVHDAVMTIDNGTDVVTLDEICTSSMTALELEAIETILGISAEQLVALNLCIYTTFNPLVWGEENTTYDLSIEIEDEVITATTKINNPVALDSVWFELSGDNDSLGFANATLTDPDTIGNSYRWFAKRINKYPDWSPYAGQVKDQGFIAPLGSVNDDQFFNGLTFDFLYNRGAATNSFKEDDTNIERGFFKVGDTIVVKSAVMDFTTYRFFYDLESQVASQGSPFATPFDLTSNINGGLGVFVGYGVGYDTIICVN